MASRDYRRKVRAGELPTDELVDALLSEEADRVRGLGLHVVGVGRRRRLLVPVAAWLLVRVRLARAVVELPNVAAAAAAAVLVNAVAEPRASESRRCCTALMSRPMRRLRRSISSCAA